MWRSSSPSRATVPGAREVLLLCKGVGIANSTLDRVRRVMGVHNRMCGPLHRQVGSPRSLLQEINQMVARISELVVLPVRR